MSLINQVLQDLDRRRASGAERDALPNQVRALPNTQARDVSWSWLWWSCGVIAAAAAGWSYWQIKVVSQNHANMITVAPTPLMPPMTASSVPAFASAPFVASGTAGADTMNDLAPAPAAMPTPAPIAEEMKTPAPAMHVATHVKKKHITPASTMAVATVPTVTDDKENSVTPSPASATLATTSPQIEKQVHELTPAQRAENEYQRGADLLGRGANDDAQAAFASALQIDPTNVAARQALFGMLYQEKRNDEAEQVLRDGLALDANQSGFAMALARLQVERGDTTGAIDTLAHSNGAAQDIPEYQAFQAALLQRVSRHEEAVACYQTALQHAPEVGVWWMGLGISLQALNRRDDARAAYMRAKASGTLTPELQSFVDEHLGQL